MRRTYSYRQITGLFGDVPAPTKRQMSWFKKEFNERLANSFLSIGCRTRGDVILLLFWYYKEFSTAIGVGKMQASQAFDWWAKQPEFDKMIKQMMVIDL